MILSPVLDLASEPRWGRVEEDFGEDPCLTGQLGLAYVRGAQGAGLNTDHTVVSEPKHFAGHGSPEGDTNTSPLHIGERELRSVMLKSFEPAFLRREWGFRGFVLSDLGAIRRLYDVHRVAATPKAAACLAVQSGVDMQFYDCSLYL